jgi:hypothetical protein
MNADAPPLIPAIGYCGSLMMDILALRVRIDRKTSAEP